MQNAEKVEIGYTLPKERWQEAAKNLEDLGNALAASLRAHNKDGRGAEDADELKRICRREMPFRLDRPVTGEVRRAQPSGRVRPGPSAHVVAVR